MAQQWLSASDPFFSQYPGTYDESGYVSGAYDSQVAGLQSPQNWEMVAPQLGWTGPTMEDYIGPDGNNYTGYSPQFLNWIQSKRAEGYDFVTDASKINKDRQTVGFRLPTGEVTNQRTVKVGGFGDFFKEFVLPSVGAYFGAGALGNALTPVTTALSGATGPGAIAAGGAMEGLGAVSGNIVGASGVPIAQVPAIGGLTAADLAGLSSDITGGLSGIAAPEQVVLQPLTDVGSIAHVQTPDVLLGDLAMELPPSGPWDMTGVPGAGVGDLYAGFADLGVPADAALAAGMGVPEGMAAIGGNAAAATRPFLSDMEEVAATEGPGVAGTGILTKGTNIPSEVLGGTGFFDPLKKFIDTPGLDTLGKLVTSDLGKTGLAGLAAYLAAKERLPQRGGGTAQAYQGPAPLQRMMVQGKYGPLAQYAAQGGLMHAYAHGGHVNMEDGGFVLTKRAVDGAGGPRGLAALVPGAQPIRGPGTGTSDSIPATIHGAKGQTPARVSNGEAYVPRETVQRMGGARQMYNLMNNLQRRA
jgi:hypothetical protein